MSSIGASLIASTTELDFIYSSRIAPNALLVASKTLKYCLSNCFSISVVFNNKANAIHIKTEIKSLNAKIEKPINTEEAPHDIAKY